MLGNPVSLTPMQAMQDLEKKRIEQIAAFIKTNAQVELSTMPILEECFKGMQRASENIKPDEVYYMYCLVFKMFSILKRCFLLIVL